MASESHTQCLLKKGNAVQVSWIPTTFANVGKYIKLRRRGTENWDDGWCVVQAWTRMSSDDVHERSQDFKKQRQASDRPRDGGRERLRVK